MPQTPESSAPDDLPFWHRLGLVWRFPFSSESLIVIGIAAVLRVIVEYLPFSMFFQAGLLAYVYRYGSAVLIHAADGNLTGPGHAARVDEHVGWSLVKLSVGLIVACVIFMVFLPIVIAVPLIAFVLLAQPAATMLTAMQGSALASINPLKWLDLMTRIGWPYLALALFSAAFFFSQTYLQQWVKPLGFPLNILFSAAIGYYFAIASFFLLGMVIYQYRDELGHEPTQTTSLPVARQKLDPDQDLLDEVQAMVQNGQLEEACKRMGAHLRARGGTTEFHQRYRKMLVAQGDHPTLLSHGQQWMSVLLANRDTAAVKKLHTECMLLNPQFVPANPNEFALLAQIVRQSDSDAALRLLSQLPKHFPKSKEVVPAMLLASEIFVSVGRQSAALQLLKQIAARYPDHPKLAELNERIVQLGG